MKPTEYSSYFRPQGLAGIEALHARFVGHAYRPNSHPTWTVAVLERGAARFSLDATQQRADEGDLFVLEPEAVHTGMAAVPEGWHTRSSTYSETGLTPHAFQVNLRIARARALLTDGVTSAAVAADCVFADQPHLTRTFKRAVGVSPGRYARARAG